MKNYLSKIVLASILLLLVMVFVLPSRVSATACTELNGWAWSSNIGWISFNSSDAGAGGGPYKVSIDDSKYLSGYAWSPNIGWIQFGGLSNFPVGSNTYSQNAQIVGSQLRGWAKAISADGNNGWDGWISLSGNSYGVVQGSPNLNGYAWGSNILGWIDFSRVTTGCTAAFPVLSVGDINISNPDITMLQKDSKMAWYEKLFQSSVSVVKNTISSIAYASGTAISGKPIQLATRITNLGVAVPAGTTFTNKYFIDKPDSLGYLNSDLNKGVLTGWDSTITLPVNSGIGAGDYINSIGNIAEGLPPGINGIMFCADVDGTVSDPTQPLVSRCTDKLTPTIGPAQVGGVTLTAKNGGNEAKVSSSSAPKIMTVFLNSPVTFNWTIDKTSVANCEAVGPAWRPEAKDIIESDNSGEDNVGVSFTTIGERNFEIMCDSLLGSLGETASSSVKIIVSDSTGGTCPAPGIDSHKSNCVLGDKSAVTSSPSKWTWTCGGVACSESKSPIFVEP